MSSSVSVSNSRKKLIFLIREYLKYLLRKEFKLNIRTYPMQRLFLPLNKINFCKRFYLKEFHKNGVLHRDHDLPAKIKDSPSNILFEFYKNGVLHREGNLPARIYFSKINGGYETILREYFRNGEYYRDHDLPTRITYYENIKLEEYLKEGIYHRDTFPATIKYFKRSNLEEFQIFEKRFYIKGKLLNIQK